MNDPKVGWPTIIFFVILFTIAPILFITGVFTPGPTTYPFTTHPSGYCVPNVTC